MGASIPHISAYCHINPISLVGDSFSSFVLLSWCCEVCWKVFVLAGKEQEKKLKAKKKKNSCPASCVKVKGEILDMYS